MLVALVLLEAGCALFLIALFGSARLDRDAASRAAVDIARRDTVLALESAASCLAAPHPDSFSVALPGAAGRPPLVVTYRCGR